MATFWAMLNDEEEIGCTLHSIVDGTIDTGPIIGLSRTPVRTDWSYLANVLELYPDGCRMMVDAMRKISAGETLATSPQTAEGHYYSMPPRILTRLPLPVVQYRVGTMLTVV